MNHRGDSAFTLIEIMAVLGIIAVMATLATAGMTQALEKSKAVKCLNNLRQIGTAARLYASENGGQLPKSQHQSDSWVGSLQIYLGGTSLYRCPMDPNKTRLYSYAINDYLTPNPYGAESVDFSRQQNIPKAAETLLMAECHQTFSASDHFHFADSEEGGCTPAAFATQVDTTRHRSTGNYLFADGHVLPLAWSAVTQKLEDPNSQFIHP